ncbi:hypothetical protein AHAS_Ahas20G0024100 [Arachis hypogaea]
MTGSIFRTLLTTHDGCALTSHLRRPSPLLPTTPLRAPPPLPVKVTIVTYSRAIGHLQKRSSVPPLLIPMQVIVEVWSPPLPKPATLHRHLHSSIEPCLPLLCVHVMLGLIVSRREQLLLIQPSV